MKKNVVKDITSRLLDIKEKSKNKYIGAGHVIYVLNSLYPGSFSIGVVSFKYTKAYNAKKYAKVNKSESGMSLFVGTFFQLLDQLQKTIEQKDIHPSHQLEIIYNFIADDPEVQEWLNGYVNYCKENGYISKETNMDEIFDDEDDFEEDLYDDFIETNNSSCYNNRENLDKVKGLYNINKRVHERQIHVVGREKELEEAFTTLSKKVKANILLLGEAGVGKTAVVEKMAEVINSGEVLDNFKESVIYELSVNELLAGTKYRGEFEEKVSKVLESVMKEENVILFIDEIHNAVSAGKGEDSSNGLMEILKPFLSRSNLRVIGATTYDEYRRIFCKNKATDRRFEVINVSEPNKKETLGILKGIKESYEAFHNIKIPTKYLSDIVDYSEKYISNKKFPDKAIDVLDYICAKAKNEKIDIDRELVKKAIEKMANVKLENDLTSENFKKHINKVIKGQDEAINSVSEMINLINLGIIDKQKPLASFLFTGPTGVGKTEMARQIAKVFFGSEDKLIKIDMSDYPEKHDIAKLTGATPGYVGYNDGSLLLNSVKKQPYSLILLDEVEKAHPDITNVFLQILDDGFLTSAEGEKIDFRNTIIIMTSNLGCHQSDSKVITFGTTSNEATKTMTDMAIKKFFKPEFLNRIDKVVYFNKLTKETIKEIAENYMSKFGKYKLSDEELDIVIKKAEVETYGARAIQKTIRAEILPNKVVQEKVSHSS